LTAARAVTPVTYQYHDLSPDLGFGTPFAAQERQASPYLLDLFLGDPLDVLFGDGQVL
jgi:hypothetical protein